MAVRWLEHLHARETQKRRRSRDEEWFSHGESFNPTDLGAMLMSVAGFTLPSKEEIEQSLNTFWNRWMFFGGGHFGQNHQQSVSMYFMVFASCSFVLTLLLVVLLGMRYDFSRLAIILKEAVKSSRQNVSANSVKSIWFTLSSLVFARELMKAVKRRVFKRRLRRQRELRRRLNQQQQQQQQQEQQSLQQREREGEGGSGERSENIDAGNTTAGARRRLEKIVEENNNNNNNNNSSSKTTDVQEISGEDDEGEEQNRAASSPSPKAAPKGNLPRRGSMLGLFVKESRKHSHQEAFFDVANERTTFKGAGVDNPDVVQKLDYEKFRDRLATGELSAAAKKNQKNNNDNPRFFEDEQVPKCDYGEWQEMMRKEDKETGSTYVAWRHILPYGGTEYLSKSTFQNCTPEELCDFFNSDQTRKAWDPLLIKSEIIERDVNTGADLVYWERKLPVISNRDYVFSRRTWTEKQKSPANQMFDDLTPPTTPMKGGGMRSAADFLSPSTSKNNKSVYFSITKGMSHPNVPKSKRVLRVDPYYSAWKIEAVPDFENEDEVRGLKPYTAARCTLIHFEEQHVQHDVARLAVRHGMWSVVKPMIRGFRAFQRVRETKFIEQDSGGFNRRDQDMLEDVVHEKQVGFRMRKELGMAMKTFVVPMLVGFLLAKQSFGGGSDINKLDVVGKLLRALERKANRGRGDGSRKNSSASIVDTSVVPLSSIPFSMESPQINLEVR
ncbi:predicted protein [Bathycoccus prasinos]|jgi:hypothetical protein|uniref:START domain-containing protein n=1 Tax=Bathycoccus prasinos TaxID=41875 RepID=K8F6D2_9CHLO|nr:predicted protein [Bathycoccus prasinos]CCO17133.1 predicted protein [Bathycoccus prasinos]|mmetsp:Transcript_2466/g.7903  ORF Transcript_2466/g.7903 Transcript_2466/m.7903 type:complete len:725 (+) Transcript_2466:265-2439(+)|eukprot:XP_007512533.1 predicted protein [Bathycoccus prasinos]